MPVAGERAQIGENIRAARVAAGLNRHQLGVLFGVTAQTVGHWELGETRFRPETLAMIADRLGVDVQRLTRGVKGGAR